MDRRGHWGLSPAYDVTYAYSPTSFWLSKHQMSAAGKLEGFSMEDLYAAGRSMNINRVKMTDIINSVADAITRWPKYAEEAAVPEQRTMEIFRSLTEVRV